jgi:hypothetical protein
MILTAVETPFADAGVNTTAITDGMSALQIMDTMFPFILAGLAFAIIISASMLDTHPAMFAFTIILFMVMLVLWMVVGNVFYEFSTTSDMAATRTAMHYTTLIFDNILMIGFVVGLIIMIALYAKYKSGGGNTY